MPAKSSRIESKKSKGTKYEDVTSQITNKSSYVIAKEDSLGKVTNDKAIQDIYQQIKEVLIQHRSRAWQAVNTEMVLCYWQIGRLIVEEEQRGERRAVYGKRLIQEFSGRLTNEFGRGFHQRNLWFMRIFYLAYPKVNALRSELSWTHYRSSSNLCPMA